MLADRISIVKIPALLIITAIVTLGSLGGQAAPAQASWSRPPDENKPAGGMRSLRLLPNSNLTESELKDRSPDGSEPADEAIANPTKPFLELSDWTDFFNSRPPDPPNDAGGRGGFCPIAPVVTASTAPNAELPLAALDAPTLTWQETIRTPVNRVELWRSANAARLWYWDEAEAIGVEQVRSVQLGAATVEQAIVAVELQPEQQYEWRVYQPLVSGASVLPFRTVSAAQQAALQQTLPIASSDSEASQLRRADYYASQQLWSNFWQEILSIEAPTAAVQQTIDETVARLCP